MRATRIQQAQVTRAPTEAANTAAVKSRKASPATTKKITIITTAPLPVPLALPAAMEAPAEKAANAAAPAPKIKAAESRETARRGGGGGLDSKEEKPEALLLLAQGEDDAASTATTIVEAFGARDPGEEQENAT